MQKLKNRKNTVQLKEGSFISGAGVLILSTLFVKVMGVLFKIPMLRCVGIEGMGYFNAAYHFYALLVSVSTAGLPVALSIIVAKSAADKTRDLAIVSYRCAIILFGTLGALLSVCLYVSAPKIAELLNIPGATECLRAISPAVLLMAVSGAVRGYFQGYGIMKLTAVSQIIEAAGKLFPGLLLAILAIDAGKGPETVASRAVFGLSVGEAVSTLYLILGKRSFDRKKLEDGVNFSHQVYDGSIARRLIRISVPITLGSVVLSATSFLDTLVIPSALQLAGASQSMAVNLYSTYTSLALPLFGFPSAFIVPISSALVPEISYAMRVNDKPKERQVLDSALKLCSVISFPFVFGMLIFSENILNVIFKGSSEAVSVAAPLLSVLSVSLLLSGLMTVFNSMLQAYGRRRQPIIALAVGAAVKLVSELILVSAPGIGIYGAPISTILCSLTVVSIDLRFMSKATSELPSPISAFIRPLFSSVLSVLLAAVIYALFVKFTTDTAAFLVALAVLGISYLTFILRTGALTEKDVMMLPCGEKICRVLMHTGLMK